MTPTELRAWRMRHNLRQSDLAKLLGVRTLTVLRWENAQIGIPPYLALALETLAQRLARTCPAVDV
jgi:transcriptional regulator with XRE-family HTH domain